MKCEFEINVINTRPYVFNDKNTGEHVEMTEIVFTDDENNVYKTSKKGVLRLETGVHKVVINIRPNALLKPEVGVIEF